MRFAIRGFKGAAQLFEAQRDFSDEEIDDLIPTLAKEHANALAAGWLTMIEIEFVDDPDREHFRIGTDPRLMVRPVAVDLAKLGDKRND